MNSKIKEIPLETHPTKDTRSNKINGTLSVIWRDWDKFIENDPKMVYVSSVHPRGIKGPHLHKKRNSCFVCIKGKVIFIVKENGKYTEILADENNPKMVYIPKNVPSAHINLSENISSILTLADISWKPNDNEMENVNFEDYNWEKWTKFSQ
ncbi:sugar 3,4-ketoisomerase [Nitrosopumilus maritimus]|uniref:Sugar 3,4-ketoisomerase QdtA cupin domain-containing protein n=1 Tax=Nitrosopumilus maritimus (strain SCM1) TaxID=436308 RepID=A9A1S4_NITMS|nr:FdtA/QdtA family cupin domain-containing protein [Nitrosopumilus maritimus]ABX12045.1 hypothetical protein Nmar_0145 [Nitrosopumilus maritimus SCM1]